MSEHWATRGLTEWVRCSDCVHSCARVSLFALDAARSHCVHVTLRPAEAAVIQQLLRDDITEQALPSHFTGEEMETREY